MNDSYLDALKAAGAIFSECGRWRYALYRRLPSIGKSLPILFLMQNGSKAGLFGTDDLTVKKCRGFSIQWGYDELFVANLWAWVSTDPRGVVVASRKGINVGGPENPRWTVNLVDHVKRAGGEIVVAWGDGGRFGDRDIDVMDWLENVMDVRPVALGTTASGSPRHPSRLPYSTPRQPISWKIASR